MRFIFPAILLAIFCLPLAGCDQSADYKEIALSNEKFSSPLVLHFDRDGYDENQILQQQNGVDPSHYEQLMAAGNSVRPVYGSHPPYYPGCYEQYEPPGPPSNLDFLALDGRIGGYKFQSPNAVLFWALNHDVLAIYASKITYPNLGSNWEGNTKIWYCPVVNDKFAGGRFLPGNPQEPHHGTDLIVGNRTGVHWTFSNVYDADIPTKGKVKVFSGSFTYTINSTATDISFGSDGSASIKMFLDPDNGKWTIVDFPMHEPSITLNNAQAPAQIYMQLQNRTDIAADCAAAGKCRAWLGVVYRDLSTNGPAQITYVQAGSPAELSGAKVGDVIESANDAPIRTSADFNKMAGRFAPGAQLVLRLQRGGQPVSLDIKLGSHPAR